MNATPSWEGRGAVLPPEMPSPDPGSPSRPDTMRQASGNALAPGARLAEFEILSLIGADDSGIVYRARDHFLEREVALREYLPPDFAARAADGAVAPHSSGDAEAFQLGLRGFLNEARLLARLDHPALIKVLRFWEANGSAYIAMPYHDGLPLQDALRAGRMRTDERSLLALLAELLDALELLHGAHCIHGGIAPDTVLLLANGRALLPDAGAARQALGDLALAPGTLLKPGFAPIEQYEAIPGLKPGPWTDLYALAAVAYSLIAGNAPPPAEQRLEHDEMLPAREAGRGRYRDGLLAALDVALALLPERRPQSAAQLRSALGLGAAPDADEVTLAAPRGSAIIAAAVAADAATLSPADAAAITAADAATITAAAPQPAIGAGSAAASQQRGPAAAAAAPRKREGLTEALLVVCIAGALYLGFRSFAPRQASVEPPAAATVTPTAPAANQPNPAAAAPSVAANAPGDATPGAAAAGAPGAPQAASNPAPALPGGRDARPAAAAKTEARPALEAKPGAEAERREEESWLAAQSLDTPGAYEAFLVRYPDSRHVPAARVILARLRWERREAANQAPKPAAPAVESAAAAAPAPRSAETAAGAAPAAEDRIALARPPEAAPVPAGPKPQASAAQAAQPAQPAQESMSSEGRVIRLPGQTMTGNFSTDPITGAVSGRGRIVWDNGDRFEGTLVRGVKQGRGEFIWANGQRYKGDWARGLPNGRGSIQFPNGNRYEGEMRDGAPNGNGSIWFSNGNRYQGSVRDGLPHGSGSNRYANGDSYSGAWSMGKSHGHGRYTWANGDYWEGEFRDGVKTGDGNTVYAAKDKPAPARQSDAENVDPFLR
jgi:hypothetical protein